MADVAHESTRTVDELSRALDVIERADGDSMEHEVEQEAKALGAEDVELRELGDRGASLEHALLGVGFLDDDVPLRTRGIHLMILADALGSVGSFDDARERYAQADRVLLAAGEDRIRVNVLNNLAYTEYEAGKPTRAWAAASRLKALAAGQRPPLEAMYVDTIARAQIGIARYADAEATLNALAVPFDHADAEAEHVLTLAETQRRQGHAADAQRNLDESLRICDERGLADVRMRVLQEQAEVHAVQGRHREAFEVYKRFHADADELHSRQREAQARTRQA